MNKQQDHWPFPELVEPKDRHDKANRDYFIANTPEGRLQGVTDNDSRRMMVPLNEAGRGIARHELGHTKWSPVKVPKVRYDNAILQAVEDARVNLGLESAGIPMQLGGTESEQLISRLFDQDAAKNDMDRCILRALSAVGTSVEHRLKRKVRGLKYPWSFKGETWIRHIENALTSGAKRAHDHVGTFKLTRKLALQLSKDMALVKQEEEDKEAGESTEGPGGSGSIGKPGSGTGTMAHHPPAATKPDRPMRQPEPDFSGPAPKPRPHRPRASTKQTAPISLFDGASDAEYTDMLKDEIVPWEPPDRRPEYRDKDRDKLESGTMKIVRPRLRVRQKKIAAGNARRPSADMEGTMIRRPDRLCIDRAIFSKTKQNTGCTILFDVSGSMRLSQEGVEKMIIEAGGYATVATYCGNPRGYGVLKIVAHNSYRCGTDDITAQYGGNVIDEPALRWLSKQPAPRIWISDGSVTGIGDRSSPRITDICSKIVEKGRITRSHDVDAAISLITELRTLRGRMGRVKMGEAVACPSDDDYDDDE